LNPREAVIVAGGGAAGMGIAHIARELGTKTVLLPKVAGALSASGMQFSDIVAEQAKSCVTRTDEFDAEAVNACLDGIENELAQFLETLAGKGFDDHTIEFTAEARYLFQVWELDVRLPCRRFASRDDVGNFVEAFHAAHDRVFAVRDERSPIECLNWKGRLSVRITDAPGAPEPASQLTAAEPDMVKRAFFGSGTDIETPVFDGRRLKPGHRVAGPAIIVEPTTTIVADDRTRVRITDGSNYLLEVAP
jgi:N-methylhydantoinase A